MIDTVYCEGSGRESEMEEKISNVVDSVWHVRHWRVERICP